MIKGTRFATDLGTPPPQYEPGRVCAEAEESARSCAPGLHVSTPFYWADGDKCIAVKVRASDVVTCQAGKLRVRKLTVIGEVEQ